MVGFQMWAGRTVVNKFPCDLMNENVNLQPATQMSSSISVLLSHRWDSLFYNIFLNLIQFHKGLHLWFSYILAPWNHDIYHCLVFALTILNLFQVILAFKVNTHLCEIQEKLCYLCGVILETEHQWWQVRLAFCRFHKILKITHSVH